MVRCREENLYIAYVSSALRFMYSKIAKPQCAKFRGMPNPLQLRVRHFRDTLRRQIDYFFLAANSSFWQPDTSFWPPDSSF